MAGINYNGEEFLFQLREELQKGPSKTSWPVASSFRVNRPLCVLDFLPTADNPCCCYVLTKSSNFEKKDGFWKPNTRSALKKFYASDGVEKCRYKAYGFGNQKEFAWLVVWDDNAEKKREAKQSRVRKVPGSKKPKTESKKQQVVDQTLQKCSVRGHLEFSNVEDSEGRTTHGEDIQPPVLPELDPFADLSVEDDDLWESNLMDLFPEHLDQD